MNDMLTRVNHVALAVPDLSAAVARYRDGLMARVSAPQALPDHGVAMAVKCEDGTTRAAESMIFALVARYFEAGSPEREALMALANRTMKNWNGITVGEIRATDAMFA